MDPLWRNKLLVCRVAEDGVTVASEPQLPMRQDLLELFEHGELAKYYTGQELTTHPAKKES
jgi:succinate dehydrogenase / fumarate reductase flavoprotein subunit